MNIINATALATIPIKPTMKRRIPSTTYSNDIASINITVSVGILFLFYILESFNKELEFFELILLMDDLYFLRVTTILIKYCKYVWPFLFLVLFDKCSYYDCWQNLRLNRSSIRATSHQTETAP